MVQGKITEADTLTIRLGATPSGLISNPPPSSHHFYAGCPSCRNPPTLSRLGTGTKHAGLHTQRCGFSIACTSIIRTYHYHYLCFNGHFLCEPGLALEENLYRVSGQLLHVFYIRFISVTSAEITPQGSLVKLTVQLTADLASQAVP